MERGLTSVSKDLESFVRDIIYLTDNKEIFRIYKKYLKSGEEFKNIDFIIGINDSTTVNSSRILTSINDKVYQLKNKLYLYNSIINFNYFLFLNSDLKEKFNAVSNIFLDTNSAGIISKFIENEGEIVDNFIMDYFREGIFNISFIFYAFENLYNPYKNMINEKSKNILKNLCKFNSIGKNYEIYKNTIKFTYNKSYAEQMYNKFMYAFDEQTNIKLSNCILKFKFGDYFCYLIAMFNQIYSLLLLPFTEKNGSKFNIEKSICNLYNIMHKYGCKNFSLLQFIFQYFKNDNNEFFNATDPNNAKEKILNMSWDILSSYTNKC